MTATKTYACAHCGETFSNYVRRYQHVRDRHPEQRRTDTAPTARDRTDDSALKRPTDTWPARP